MKFDGRCHCSAIGYEVETDPGNVLFCHCGDCRAMSDTPFPTAVRTGEANFKLLSGRPGSMPSSTA